MAPRARTPGGDARGRAGRPVLRSTAAAAALVLCGLVGASGLGVVGGVPAASASTAPRQSSGGLMWQADANPDLLSNFDRTEFNEQGGKPQVVDSPNVGGRKALQFTVHPAGGRSELLPKVPEQHDGQTLYFGYNGFLPDDYPIDDTKYQIIMQWHHEGDSGSPPLAIHARNDKLILAGGDDEEHQAYEETIGPAHANMPVNLVLRITFSRDSSTGSVDVWDAGKKVVSDFHPPDGTLFDDGDYLKVGMYRDTSLDDTARVYVNNVAVGSDFDAVNSAVNLSGANDDSSTSGGSSSGGGLPVGTIVAVALVVLVLAGGAVVLARRRHDRSARP